jgi:hypothetical protein
MTLGPSCPYCRPFLVLLCAETGIDGPDLFDNSAAYIAGWLSRLNHDRTLVVAAAAQAQRTCDLIRQVEHEAIRDASHHPQATTGASQRYADDSRTERAGPVTEHRGAAAGPIEKTSDWDAEAS